MPTVLLLVATRKGGYILESSEDRTNWTVNGPFLKGWDVADLVADTRSDLQLYGAVGHFVYGPTIHRSDDRGETWQQATLNPSYPEDASFDLESIWTIVPGPESQPDTLYAGVADAGLFVTHDRGDTWTELSGLRNHPTSADWFPGNGGLCCHSILIAPDDPDRIWVGISAVGVFRSDDGGETWQLKNDGLDVVAPDEHDENLGSCVHRLIMDPTDADRLFQQNHQGVYRSATGGDYWEPITEGLPSTFGFPIVMNPHDPDMLFTFPLESDEYRFSKDGAPAVYRTATAGDSWTRIDTGLPTESWVTVLRQAMATDELHPAGVYVGTTGGQIFHSSDAGATWDTINCTLPRIQSLNTVVLE